MGPRPLSRLLHWTRSNAAPGLLSDIFARVGGPNQKEVTAKVMQLGRRIYPSICLRAALYELFEAFGSFSSLDTPP